MATYSHPILKGRGTPTEALAGAKTFTFHNPGTNGSAYFTFETVRATGGVYDASSVSYALGTYSQFADTDIAKTSASVTFDAGVFHPTSSFYVNTILFSLVTASTANTADTIYVVSGSNAANTVINLTNAFNASASVSPYNTTLRFITASYSSNNITLTYTGSNGLTGNNQFVISGSTTASFTGGTNYDNDITSPNNGLVTSSYIFSVVVPPGTSSFDFTPTTNVPISGAWLRGTGEFTLIIS